MGERKEGTEGTGRGPPPEARRVRQARERGVGTGRRGAGAGAWRDGEEGRSEATRGLTAPRPGDVRAPDGGQQDVGVSSGAEASAHAEHGQLCSQVRHKAAPWGLGVQHLSGGLPWRTAPWRAQSAGPCPEHARRFVLPTTV